jgi:hypothetical protein
MLDGGAFDGAKAKTSTPRLKLWLVFHGKTRGKYGENHYRSYK